MKIERVRFGWKPAVLVAIAIIAAACGSSDPLSGVNLEIYDSSVIRSPTTVILKVFDGPGGNQIATLDRTAPAQASASSLLDSVLIVPGANGAFRTLHIEGRRSNGGAMTSWGSVDVSLIANRQVSARLMLGSGTGPTDAGVNGSGGTSGGSGLGGSGAAGSGAGGSGAGGSNGSGGTTPPTDAAMPPVDSRSTLAANGTACQLAGTCASGFCVDGVCCDSACNGLCHGCNLSGSRGTCSAFAAGSQCAPPSCATNGTDLLPARTCDSSGNCNAAGAAQSCGRYRCQNDACLRSCSSSNACVSGFHCFQNRCL
jgi:hypothetical protein